MVVSTFFTKKSLFLHIRLFVRVPFGCFKADIMKLSFNFIDGSNAATTNGAYSSMHLEN